MITGGRARKVKLMIPVSDDEYIRPNKRGVSPSELIRRYAHSRKHMQRLLRLAERMEQEEARLHKIYGEAPKGSLRGSARLDAAAIRGVLAAIEGA